MQRLDGERHAAAAGMIQQRCDSFSDLHPRAGDVLRAIGQAADDEDQAFRADCRCVVHRSPVVVQRCQPAGRGRGREHAAAAQAGDPQVGIPDEPGGASRPAFVELVAPRRDAADAVPGAAGDALLQGPLRADRCCVE